MRKILILICVSAVLLAACSDDDCVQCPGRSAEPTLANIWPHADGNTWIYDLDYSVHAGLPLPGEGEPLPSLAELHEALAQPVGTALLDEDRGLYRTRLEGEVTTESGVTAQNLVGTFYSAITGATARAEPAALLRLIARARPDLRAAILARDPEVAARAQSLADAATPYFLGGYAFAAEEDGYFGYGDLDTEHSWIYLQGDLAVGSQFSLQLIPDLADDVWLHGRVWSIEDRSLGGALYRNALECMYLVDLGVQTLTDEGGNPIGTSHAYIYGATTFAPGVGPVASRERWVLGPDPLVGQEQGQVITYDSVLAGAAIR